MRERILLVDDEQAFCLTLKRALERRGYEVETAFDGHSAIALAQKSPFDLVVVDVRMPDINGLEAFRAVKDVQPRVEGIVMTGYASYEAPVNAIKLGVRDYLGKPFELDEFIAAIERVLAQARTAQVRQRKAQLGRRGYLASLSTLAQRLRPLDTDPGRLASDLALSLGLGETRARELSSLAWLSRLGRSLPMSELTRSDMESHWRLLQEVVEPVEEFRSFLPTLSSLYERFDGQGFPEGLAQDDIPQAARILTAATVLAEEGPEAARRLAGGLLDPSVLEALLQGPGTSPAPSLAGEARYAAMVRLAAACRQAGDVATTEAALALASEAALSLGDGEKQAACLMQQAWLWLDSGKTDQVQATLDEALRVARQAGPTAAAHVLVDRGRVLQGLHQPEAAEVALKEAASQFERWQWHYQRCRANLLLAQLYRGWKEDESRRHIDTVLQDVQHSGFEDLLLWEWDAAGPLLAASLGTQHDALILSVLDKAGPAALSLWPDRASVPAAVRQLAAFGGPSEQADALPLIRLQCFGEFTVLVGGQPVRDTEWRGRKSKNLLAYLILQQGRMVAADVLMELFWPDSPEDKARHNLHMAVHRVRKALETAGSGAGQLLGQQADRYSLNVDVSQQLDLQQFEARFASGRGAMARGDQAGTQTALLEADRLYGGELLANAPYEDWTMELRETYRRKHQDVLLWLSRSYQASDRRDVAATCARRLFAADPTREESARLLMQILAGDGRREEATRVYAQFCKVLDEEVGVAPLPETRTLYEQILEGVACA